MAASGTGLNKNTAAALSYVLGPVSGVLFLALEKDKYVRFHAMQSIVFSIAVVVLDMVLGFTIILALILPLLWIGEFIVWLVLMYKAWQGEEWELPVLGKFARQMVQKV
ncbi:MAG TPA: DUF4870 domain-containing protein [Patescibacteria group bacterium]